MLVFANQRDTASREMEYGSRISSAVLHLSPVGAHKELALL
jgi:hypothetical protein